MKNLIMSSPKEFAHWEQAERFYERFANKDTTAKYILGINVYTESLLQSYRVDGIIDDFSKEADYQGVPIIPFDLVPSNAQVLVASGGMPMTAMKRVMSKGLDCLDYFAFQKVAPGPLRELVFNENFQRCFVENEARYEWAYNQLYDDTSRSVFQKLISFRLKQDLALLDGFSDCQSEQYFEDFLCLQKEGESFCDIGAYDGFTSIQFMKRCPRYQSIHVFEPEPENYTVCRDVLKGIPRLFLYDHGLGDREESVSIVTDKDASAIQTEGDTQIFVKRLDDVLQSPPTFIKVDVEGYEVNVLNGAEEIIRDGRPRLAVSVYHHPDDFWRIPQTILAWCDRYKVYLRHYTESIYETVMFFVPAEV